MDGKSRGASVTVSLEISLDIELLKAEMVLVGVIQSGSSISGKAYEKFFSLLNDTSVMLKLELFKKIVEVTFATTKQVWAQLYQNSEETSSKYPYPPDFQPSEDIKAVLAEEAPKSKEFYDTILAGIIGTEQVLHSSASALNNSNDNSLSKGRKDGQPNKIAKPIGREISSKKDHYCQPSFQACLFKGSPASDNVQCKSLGRAERKNVPMRHESAFQDSNYRWHRIGKSKADVNLESKEESPKCNNRKLSSEVPNSRMHEFKKKNDSTDKQKVHDQSKYPCRVSSSYDSSRNMEHHVNHYYFNHVNDHKYDSSKESPELRRSKSDTRNKYDYQRRSVMSSNEEVRPGSATERSYISCFSQDDCSGESKHNRKRNYLCTDGVDSGQDRNKNNSANELFTKVTHSQHWLSREITYSDRKIHSPSKNLGDRSLQRDPRLEISRHNKPRNRDEICHYEKRKIF